MPAPNVIRQQFPKEADRAKYNEQQALKHITANLDLSIRYVLSTGPAFHKFRIHPNANFIRNLFLSICRSGVCDGEPIDEACLLKGGQWNGSSVLFAQEASPIWTKQTSRNLVDVDYLGESYIAPPEVPPAEIDASTITREAMLTIADDEITTKESHDAA